MNKILDLMVSKNTLQFLIEADYFLVIPWGSIWISLYTYFADEETEPSESNFLICLRKELDSQFPVASRHELLPNVLFSKLCLIVR